MRFRSSLHIHARSLQQIDHPVKTTNDLVMLTRLESATQYIPGLTFHISAEATTSHEKVYLATAAAQLDTV